MANNDLRQSLHLRFVEYYFNSKSIFLLIMLVLFLFFRFMDLSEIPTDPVIGILSLDALIFAFYYLLRRKNPEWAVAYNIFSLWFDILVVTVCLHFLGGIYSMFWSGTYLLYVAVAGIFMNRFARLSYAIFVVIAYSTMCYLEHQGIIPRWNVFNIPVDTKLDLTCWLGMLTLIIMTTLISFHFLEILSRLQRLASLGRMATEIVHEMRTPLQIIEGVAESHCTEDGKKEMSVQIEKLSRFLKEVMALGREEIQSLSKTRLQALVDQAIGMVSKSTESSERIKIEKNYFENETYIYVDIDQMIKAFTNLIRNGMDSIEKEGSLQIRISKAGFEWVQVEIEDSGVGIYENELEKIFEPFYTTKTGMRGIGLGLAIAKKFILANGGHIEVESRVGKGSKFTVALPLMS